MKDYLYVNLLGVTPSAQGSGLGYALMVHVIEMADEQKVPMSLITQTESNVGLPPTRAMYWLIVRR